MLFKERNSQEIFKELPFKDLSEAASSNDLSASFDFSDDKILLRGFLLNLFAALPLKKPTTEETLYKKES
jgi:hypothetical protein